MEAGALTPALARRLREATEAAGRLVALGVGVGWRPALPDAEGGRWRRCAAWGSGASVPLARAVACALRCTQGGCWRRLTPGAEARSLASAPPGGDCGAFGCWPGGRVAGHYALAPRVTSAIHLLAGGSSSVRSALAARAVAGAGRISGGAVGARVPGAGRSRAVDAGGRRVGRFGRLPRRGGLKLRRPPPIPEGMSIDAVVGRIDQIMAMQQQLADPAAADRAPRVQPRETIPGTTSATGSTPTSFSDALNSALGASALGTDTSTTDGTDPTGALTLGAGHGLAGPRQRRRARATTGPRRHRDHDRDRIGPRAGSGDDQHGQLAGRQAVRLSVAGTAGGARSRATTARGSCRRCSTPAAT